MPSGVRITLPLMIFVIIATVFYCPVMVVAETLEGQFQSELEKLRDEYKFPGGTAAYILPNGTLGTAATGYSDVEAGTPMRPESRMLAASIGKTFVGATVVSLAQEGKLGLDDLISKYLEDRPWFSRLPNHDTITVRHLLRHNAGVPNHLGTESFAKAFSESWRDPRVSFAPERLIEFVLDEPALFEPGEGWEYTDTSYILLGLIIEEVSEYTFYDEVIYRFIVPLRMNLTSPSDRVILPGLAAGYLPADNKSGLPEKTTITEGILVWNPGGEWTGGGLVSNPRDLVVFAKALFEGRAMNGPYLKELLSSVKAGPPEKPNVRYGAGVGIYVDDYYGTTYGHGGSMPGYTSSMRYYTEHGIAVSFQVNVDSSQIGDDYYEIERRLAALFMNLE